MAVIDPAQNAPDADERTYGRPAASLTLREFAAPLAWLAGARHAPKLLGAPRGDGRLVVLIPGYMTGDASMRPLGGFLSALGYRVRYSGIGVNRGDVDGYVARLGGELGPVAQDAGGPATLIGWSLGGVIAREIARLYADDVREVVTMGTPIVGGPKYTAVGDIYARLEGLDLDDFEQEVHRRNSIGITQKATSIYSKSDGIVDWRASVDVYNPQTKNIAVKTSHLGLGVNPKVWRIIADVLAEGRAR
ncbi:MAG: alpha/beta hydrolase [Pseudomonadota bacterium]